VMRTRRRNHALAGQRGFHRVRMSKNTINIGSKQA
jgi:hypothetical protein